jgi:hypothetical protein
MSALIVRLPAEKRARLKKLTRHRQTRVNMLMEEMPTILLAAFDAETLPKPREPRCGMRGPWPSAAGEGGGQAPGELMNTIAALVHEIVPT